MILKKRKNTMIDWTAIGSIATSIGVIVAVVAFIIESHRSRFTKAIDILMQFDKRFDSPEFRETRRRAAEFLLSGSKEEDKDGRQAIADVLNFFETVAFLYRNKAIKANVVWHTFASWLLPYWKAAESYIQICLLNDPNSYGETAVLFDAVWSIEQKHLHDRTEKSIITEKSLNSFLKSEAELPHN
jgi:hypothetical protein